MIHKIAKQGGKVDVYLFAKKSPCCRPGDDDVNGYDGYRECIKSCAKEITNFKEEFAYVIQNFYVSWKKPYFSVSKHDKLQSSRRFFSLCDKF